MGKRLYVGNLAFAVTEVDLRDLFTEAGKVEEASIGLPGPAGRARGFGYVEMASDEEALKAIELLHGRELQGRRINVKEVVEPQTGLRFRRSAGPRRTA